MFLDQLERFLNNQVDDNTNFNIQTLMDSMTVEFFFVKYPTILKGVGLLSNECARAQLLC